MYTFRRLIDRDFQVLTDKIIEIFPEECAKTYYIGPIKKKDSRHKRHERSRGKLIDKYRNRRTYILESDKLFNQSTSVHSVEDNNLGKNDLLLL